MSKSSAKPQRFNEAFERFWALGYRNIIPVVPADGGITSAGKRPGVLDAGHWSGRAAKDFTATQETIGVWAEMGAGLGLSCNGSGMLGLDVDSLAVEWSDRIVGLAREIVGPAPRRIGRAPKVLLPYRCDPATRYRQLRFDDGRPALVDPKTGKVKRKPALIERLAGETRFFVGWGVHPETKRLYDWPDGIPPFEGLSFASGEALDAFFAACAEILPRAVLTSASGDGRPLTPDEVRRLRGDPALVAEAIRATPNEVEFVDYNRWRDMGVALRGALPDDLDLALELYEEWTDRAEFVKPKENAYRVFNSFDPDRQELGADYVYHQAEKAGWQGLVKGLGWFDPAPPEPEDAPYESIFGGGDAAERISRTTWSYTDPRQIPARDFLYGWHIVRRFASMTVAPSKVGKSSLATVDILAMVTGRELLPGMRPKGQLRVWYINLEDPMEEIERRIAAAMLRYGIGAEDIGDRLGIDSGRSLSLTIAVESKGGVVVQRPVVEALLAELRASRTDVLVIDPFVSSHRVRENSNDAIEAVVAEWIGVADTAGVAIEFIHHARKGVAGEAEAEAVIDAARGASAMVAKMRSVRALARMTKKEGKQLGLTSTYRRLFRVTDAASNLAPWVDDETQWLKLDSVDLGNGPGDDAERWRDGDHVAVVVAWSTRQGGGGAEAVDKSEALAALGGELWREDAQARDAWVGHPIAAALHLDLSDADDTAAVRRLIGSWVKSGVLEKVQAFDKHRNKRWFVRVKSVLA